MKLVDDVPVEIPLDDLGLHQPDAQDARLLPAGDGVHHHHAPRRRRLYGVDASEIEPDPAFVGPAGWRARNGEVDASPRPPRRPKRPRARRRLPKGADGFTPVDARQPRASEALATKIDRSLYETVTSLERLDAWIADAFAAGVVAHRHGDDVARSDDLRSRRRVARSRAGPRLLHSARPSRRAATAISSAAPSSPPAQIPLEEAIERLKPLLEDARRAEDRAEYEI